MRAFPDQYQVEDLPRQATIYEVAPRDGLQAESAILPTTDKIEFIEQLIGAGLPVVEAASFVSPKWIPQLADGSEVLAGLRTDPQQHPVLVPNNRGLERAIEAGAREVAVFTSATETFARRNLNTDKAETVRRATQVVENARAAGLRVRGYVSMCFGDPWEGSVACETTVEVACKLLEVGCYQVSLGDTIGVATPGQVCALLDTFTHRDVSVDDLAMHFHDTYGQALANVYMALTKGVTVFDASAGGLGGCPYARSATGNLATEDLVWMLKGLGITTGVDLDKLSRTSQWMATRLGKPSTSRAAQALKTAGD